MKRLHRVAARLLRWNRVACLLLILCLLSSSTPAAPKTIVAFAAESRVSFAFWLNSKGGLPRLIQGRSRARAQESQADRDAKVVRLEIHPGNVTVNSSNQKPASESSARVVLNIPQVIGKSHTEFEKVVGSPFLAVLFRF